MNTTRSLVSVIIPVFNSAPYLQKTLESVRAQNFPNLEIIAIDDGSIDESKNILKSFSNSWAGRMKVLNHPDKQNHGIAASYLLGLEHCRGTYIAFLEHDDFWQANKISEQVKSFELFPEVGVVFSDVYPCDEEGRIADRAFKPIINRPPTEQPFNSFLRLLWGNCLITFSNIMVRYNQINRSDIITSPPGYQDWMLLLLLASRCKFYHCSTTKTFWRQRQNSYYAKIKKLHQYRKLRKSALKNAVEKILMEKRSFRSGHAHKKRFLKGYWYMVISAMSAGERMTDYLNRRLCNGDTTSIIRK